MNIVAGFKYEDILWAKRFGAEPLLLGPTLMDPSPLRETGKRVLFVGAFDRAENVEGAVWLVREVWPEVLASHPSARLLLAGGNPGPAIRGLQSESIEVTGYVSDLRPFYEEAACVVAPIFGGGGLRFKVPQALVFGLPLVATPLAMEGTDGLPESSTVVTATPARFAAAIGEALADRAASLRKVSPGTVWARHRFLGQDSGSNRLLEIYDGAST